MHKILFVTSEAHPLMKTGGLGDVCGSLPAALQGQGVDVRVLLPGYHDALRRAGELQAIAEVPMPQLHGSVRLLEGVLPGTRVKVWLIDYPPAFGRAGNPYLDGNGIPWSDNAARFALLARVAVAIARRRAGVRWCPDTVHCHDWQSGLVPALLSLEPERPATVFTIHNLAYQGRFGYHMLHALGLPPSLWSPASLEFYGELSFIKGGLVYADRITTVSPTYAREIQTPEFGEGLDGLLRHRADHLVGILNGIDDETWNPASDTHLLAPYSVTRLAGKRRNKAALQEHFGFEPDPAVPLLGLVNRLAYQKGIDLLLGALPTLMQTPLQIVIIGTGDAAYEDGLRRAIAQYPGRFAAQIGYDETTAHRIEAGADMFLMASRFEPCGLNQMYSLRYGTVPVVRAVGGLADTVVDASETNLVAGTATGVTFAAADSPALAAAVRRAQALYANSKTWKAIMTTGMRQDFSWRHSAQAYLRLYDELAPDIAARRARTAPVRVKSKATTKTPRRVSARRPARAT
jgi:starch synthase